jgi:uncharacterized protein (TIGR03435 family)
MKMLRYAVAALVASAAAFAQTAPTREFEVASIRPSAPFNGRLNLHVQVDGAQVHCTYFSLKDLLTMAYRVKDYQVLGPAWLASERFDVAAKLPEESARQQIPEMTQALLADRFKMKVHRESKEFSVYGLVVAKSGLKIKESAPYPDTDAVDGKAPFSVTASGGPQGTTVNLGRGSYFSVGNNRIEAKKLTMTAFADTLARFVDRPIVDMTELKGNYDFTVEFTPEDFRAMMIRGAITAGVPLPPEAMRLIEGGPGDGLFAAVQSLGLKLERRKAPLDVVVVDEASKTPTAN